ncbi:MAG: hypothetical protein WD058_07880 [Dehalococcoidia bacterium]
MADVRVDRPAHIPAVGVPGASEDRPRQQRDEHPQRDPDRRPGGREELAVVLGEPGRALAAHLETDADGAPVVRIVDRVGGETVAVVTPEELRAMAEHTGLPPGLLFQARS